MYSNLVQIDPIVGHDDLLVADLFSLGALV